MNQELATSEKYALTIHEAAQYFSIGIKKMRRLAEDNLGVFAVYSGNRYLIIRCKLQINTEYYLPADGVSYESVLEWAEGKFIYFMK